MLTSAAVCMQAVLLLSRGWFALGTSVIFGAVAMVIAWATTPDLIHGWSVGCVLYLVASYWLYTRQPQPESARRYAHGAMVMLAGGAVALAVMGEWRGVWLAEAGGLLLQRLAPIAAVWWWMRKH